MNAEEYSKRGGKYFSERNFDKAIADFSEVIKLEPKNPFAHHKRGLSYTNKKEFDLAITDFTEAIRLEPKKSGDFYFDRGGVYILKGNNALAISDLEMAVKIDPQKESYREVLEKVKSGKITYTTEASSVTNGFKKFLIIIIIGSVVGGIIGVAVGRFIGLLIGIFFGSGIGQFFSAAIAVLVVQFNKARDNSARNVAKDGILKGLLWTVFVFVFVVVFKILWKLVICPFSTIRKLVKGDYVIFDLYKELDKEYDKAFG